MPVIAAATAPTHELPGTRFTSLATPSRGTADLAVWRLEVAPGTAGAPHELTREEVFVVLEGRAQVQLGGEHLEAGAGDTILVPPGVPFALGNAADVPLHAVVCLPVGGQARMGGGEPFTPPWAQ
jgi:mannose-6-phosphate isomerase-like protein (cupin superfamily)